MPPRTRGVLAALLPLLFLFLWPTSARAQNGTLGTDYTNIMQWLSQETANGLAFNAGSTFDPPNEIAPYLIQPDFSLGIGFVPFNTARFPTLTNQSLQTIGVQNDFPSSILFPNLTAHVRMGLPDRWDVSIRVADMTIPKGYKLTPGTTGDGQSNTIGFSVRKHFMGDGDDPLISVSGNVNHVFGHFNLYNNFNNVVPDSTAPGVIFDVQNVGRLDWDVTSFGVNVVASHPYGNWTPFAGVGLNTVTGWVSGKLTTTATNATPAWIPVEGDATRKPESLNGRFIFGAQRDYSPCGFFVNSEVKTIGSEAFKTFIVSFGVARPFSFGVGSDGGGDSYSSRRTAWPERTYSNREDSDSYDSGGSRHWFSGRSSSSSSDDNDMRDAPASAPAPAPPPASSDLILIQ